MTMIRTPPGRAGRLWLAERLTVARHATNLMEQKQGVLRREKTRLSHVVEETRADWHRTATDAQRWSRRALVLGDRQELGRCIAPEPAQAHITWQTRMGVELPSTTRTQIAPPPTPAGSAAFAPAALACSEALRAAVEHAAATKAQVRVSQELDVTTRRLRAIRNRWIPRLEETLRSVDLNLDEDEREELSRLRWAQDAVPGLLGEGR